MYGQYNVLTEINSPHREALHSSLLASLLKEHEILCAFIKLLSDYINMGPSIIQILKAVSKFEEWQDDFEN